MGKETREWACVCTYTAAGRKLFREDASVFPPFETWPFYITSLFYRGVPAQCVRAHQLAGPQHSSSQADYRQFLIHFLIYIYILWDDCTNPVCEIF